MKNIIIKFLLLFCKKKTRKEFMPLEKVIDGKVFMIPSDVVVNYKELFGNTYDIDYCPIKKYSDCIINIGRVH